MQHLLMLEGSGAAIFALCSMMVTISDVQFAQILSVFIIELLTKISACNHIYCQKGLTCYTSYFFYSSIVSLIYRYGRQVMTQS